ncbi:MAG: adenylosuccinate synthase [Candidatus Peribacteria bacterium]|jgi:adenylosuccinate synthase|nr:adenylosuccinate synthase [Candidatus Peribacteria bacterium]
MSRIDVLLGLQWGDEGKGKIVDCLTSNYDVVCRFQGGPNAGHTIEFDGKKYVLRSVPSGIFQPYTLNLIGNGMVIDPVLFKQELEELNQSGYNLDGRLFISKKAHLILPTHRLLDAAYEAAKGDRKIGTTGKGIGPAYTDKISRNGLRVGNILDSKFEKKYAERVKKHECILKSLNFEYSDQLTALESAWFEAVEFLKHFQLIDGEYFVNEQLKAGKRVLVEGAQGTLLDVSYGSYPYVTSSNTITGGVCTGLGVPPSVIGEVYGIFKAYCTRVGAGPFPTELFNEIGDEICQRGQEFGSVTGRKRRCGWLDLVALRYSIMINGVTQLIMMKSDVLDTFDEVKVCVAYRIRGKETENFPFDLEAQPVVPVYETFSGWKTDLTKVTSESEFPVEFRKYILFLEKELGVPIKIVSVGPDRKQTIFR